MIVRNAEPRDIDGMRAMLNEIVSIGGSTAIEDPLSADEMRAHFLEGPEHICCVVAEDNNGLIAGFQALERKVGTSVETAYSSTFARQTNRVRGIGTALFEATKREAAEAGHHRNHREDPRRQYLGIGLLFKDGVRGFHHR